MYTMYIPLSLRLTLFYTVILGLALSFFGYIVYTQAAQRAYSDLDMTLSSRAASVQLGKSLSCSGFTSTVIPCTLPSVDSLGAGGVAIEVLDDHMHLLATTDSSNDSGQPTVIGLGSSLIPWDSRAALQSLHSYDPLQQNQTGIFSTVIYQSQHVRVYTIVNNNFGGKHIIQTARSEQDIEQSLSSLQLLLLRGGALAICLALVGGWFISWRILSRVRRITKTARGISTSQNFSRRVPDASLFGKDELATLAGAFNEVLANLAEAYQRQQRFIADASHELRAPITSIRCNLDLLEKAPDLPPEEVQAALHDACDEADRMGRLVTDLLTLANLDSTSNQQIESNGYRKYTAPRKLVDLDSLLLEIFRQYQTSEKPMSAADRQRGPRLLLQDIRPVQVFGNPDQLKQVLVALVDNALKYTPYEGTVSLSLTTDEQQALVKVTDTGIGILPEDIPHIFERFYRSDPARSRDRGGSGLGLAIVHSIVREHNGDIQLESTPGKGSTFTLTFPTVHEITS